MVPLDGTVIDRLLLKLGSGGRLSYLEDVGGVSKKFVH